MRATHAVQLATVVLLVTATSCRFDQPRSRDPAATAPSAAPRQQRWMAAPIGPNGSSIKFAFLPPLDEEYAGEVKSLRGEITLPADGNPNGMRGWFEVDTATVTMGDQNIDDNLQGSLFLSVAKFPISRFDIESVRVEPAQLYPTAATGKMHGTFTLMSRKVPLSCDVTMFAPLSDKPTLIIEANATLHLERDFALPTIDGPSPANATVNLRVRAILRYLS